MAGENPIEAGMAGRYATALFELAKDGGDLDTVAEDLGSFQAMLDESADLAALLKSPLYSADEQGRAVSALADKAGIGTMTKNFLGLVAKNRRLFATADMIKSYRNLIAQHRGEISAEVASAVALNDDQMSALKNALKDAMGKDVAIQTSVDPSLLGGLVVKVGSRMIDNSLKTKLNNLKLAMKEVG